MPVLPALVLLLVLHGVAASDGSSKHHLLAAPGEELCIGLRPPRGQQVGVAADLPRVCLGQAAGTFSEALSGWSAQTQLEGCSTLSGTTTASRTAAGDTLLLTRNVTCGSSDYHAGVTVIATIVDQVSAHSTFFRWNLSVTSETKQLWSTAINTVAHIGGLPAEAQYWVAGAVDAEDGGHAPRPVAGKATLPLGGPCTPSPHPTVAMTILC